MENHDVEAEGLDEGCSKGPCLRFILGRPFQLL